jgi:hypothetical protein
MRNAPAPAPFAASKIVYTDWLLNLLDVLRSLDLSGQRMVSAQVGHFSSYAVAY